MSGNDGVQLSVTPEAKEQVQQLIKGQKAGTVVRVYLQPGGGCGPGCGCGAGGGGPAFGMAFDRERGGDTVIPIDGFSIVVDDMSAEFLHGATIDYIQDLNASGFKITAPNLPAPADAQAGGCGCGTGGCGCG